MKTPLKCLSMLFISVLFFASCKGGSGESKMYNRHVEAYSNGMVSRTSPICLILSTDVNQSTMDAVPVSDILEISPSVEGKYSYADGHTLVFTPSTSFDHNTTYTVEADLGRLFDTDGDEDSFTFSFTTLPLNFVGSLDDFSENGDGTYAFTFSLTSADTEEASLVESSINVAGGGATEWKHAPNGRDHTIVVKLSAASSEGMLSVEARDDAAKGLKAGTIATASVPSNKGLSVYSVESRFDEQRYVEIVFNKRLDSRQNMIGLATIENNYNQSVDVEGNKLRLYPDDGRSGDTKVLISSAIRSAESEKLGRDETHTINLSNNKPAVEFVGNGCVMPLSEQVTVSFRSIYMRAVRVRAFRIFANNIGRMLQEGNISDSENLRSLGRPMAVKTIILDDKKTDLSQWHTYSIDLNKLIQAEPGAIYRIELQPDYAYTAWPEADVASLDEKTIASDDMMRFANLCSYFDNSGYYYVNDDYDWNTYKWNEEDKPDKPSYYMSKTIGRNILATNIGLSAIMGESGSMKVTALNLCDALPRAGINIEVFSAQNQLIGTAKTDENGAADISVDLTQGCPLYITAASDNDRAYLRVSRGDGLSTSTFDVEGQETTKGLKGFIYGDRGVWRPGDTLNISFMLNDRDKVLPEEHPVVAELFTPLGQLYKKITRASGAMGLYSFNIPTSPDAVTGSWEIRISVGGVQFSKRLRVETIKPNRLKIALDMPDIIKSNLSQTARLHTEWLSGAQTNALKYDLTATFSNARTTWKGLESYTFDNPGKNSVPDEMILAKGKTDSQGDAVVALNTALRTKDVGGLLRANIATRVFEESGEFSTDAVNVLYSPYPRYVGIKGEKDRWTKLDTGKDHTFNLISVDADGRPMSNIALTVNIYKVNYYWWWSSSSTSIANFIQNEYNKPIKRINVTTDGSGTATFKYSAADEEWGTYLITATDKGGGHTTNMLSRFDLPGDNNHEQDSRKGSVVLTLNTDKSDYQLGEKVKLSFPSSPGCRAIINVCNGTRVINSQLVNCTATTTTVDLDTDESMIPNGYVCVSLVQPYAQTANDMPIRLYGICPFNVNTPSSRLLPQIDMKDDIRPERKAEISISEKEGRRMAYTLAIVDEGLLDLTRFATPDAWGAFNAREALGLRLWDIYGDVNGAFGGRIEQMFSIGGDSELNSGPKAIVNRFTPMVHFEGPFILEKGKSKKHEVMIPNYNGRVRVMVVAGDGTAYGNTEKSVSVTKPLMVIGTMPRLVGVDDEFTVAATVFANKEAAGNAEVKIETNGLCSVVGDNSKNINISREGDITSFFTVKAGKKEGTCLLTLTASNKNDKATYTVELPIRQISQELSQSEYISIKAGSKWDKKLAPAGDGTAQIAVELSANPPLNLSSRLRSMMTIPYDGMEQLVSKSLTHIYLDDFTDLTQQQKTSVENMIKMNIDKMRKYATADGGFSYWAGNSYSSQWMTAYAYLFMTEAEAKGYYIPSDMKKNALAYLKKAVRQWKSNDEGNASTVALSLLSLANGRQADISTMNRMREALGNKGYIYTNAKLAAAYALAGQKDAARKLLSVSASDTYETLIAQTLVDDSNAPKSADVLRQELIGEQWMSSLSISNNIFGLAKYFAKNKASETISFSISNNGKAVEEIKDAKGWQGSVASAVDNNVDISIKNNGKGIMQGIVTINTMAVQGEVPAISNGLSVSARYTTIEGTPVDLASIAAGTTFKAVVSIRNTTGRDLSFIGLNQILPAGWEILKCEESSGAASVDIRDDRLMVYFDTLTNGTERKVETMISATHTGKFYMPAITAEAMYEANVMGCTNSTMTEVVNNR